MNNKIAYQCENVLSNFNLLLPHFNNIKLYSTKEHNLPNTAWPGLRSYELSIEQPFLFFLIVKTIQDLKLPFLPSKFEIKMYVHLRRKKDDAKDWIHRDSTPFISNNEVCNTGVDFSGLIYLNKTNLMSGTYLYDDETQNITNDFKYVQNRLVIFSSNYLHKGYGHFGDNSNNGRTTLNIFIKNV